MPGLADAGRGLWTKRPYPGRNRPVTNFEAENKELSDFIIQELLVAFSNIKRVKVVERSRLELLQSELNFNMSGSVSDETAQGIGRMIGAEILFSGSISEYRDMYRMRVQAIVIETAQIIGTRTINIKYDPTLTGLLGRINPGDLWKYQWVYAGFSAGYAAQILKPPAQLLGDDGKYYYFEDAPIAFSLYALIQPSNVFGIAVDIGGDSLEGPVISIAPTLTIRPSAFEIDLFLGIGATLVSGDMAIFGGIRGGHKVGPGILYAEVRPIGFLKTYERDYGGWYETSEYMTFHLNISLGYELGFGQRKK